MSILLGAKTRRKVLVYLFTHPDENYYVRELAGMIDEDAGNLSRELRILEKEGLFCSFTRGRLKIYSLNKQYPLYDELKNIVFKTEGVEGSLRGLAAKYDGISCAFLYGSYAGRIEKKNSDVDMVVIGTFQQNIFVREIRALESKLNREINFTSYTREEFLKEKRDRGGFLNMILKGKTVVLKGKLSHG